MLESPLAAHAATPAELKQRIEVAQAGDPFLVLRDANGTQMLLSLADRERITIGRRPENDIPLPWDGKVSRLHAELERVGGDWVVVDDGLSTNGTWLGDSRLSGRARLRDGDLLRIGNTMIAFCAPDDGGTGTALADDPGQAVKISPAQKRVLVALCRPALEGRGLAVPPTNQQVAQELFLSVDSVKTHMRALLDAFGLDLVPQGQKRSSLIERALRMGFVTERDLRGLE
jgi:FHA domain-containing protein